MTHDIQITTTILTVIVREYARARARVCVCVCVCVSVVGGVCVSVCVFGVFVYLNL